MLAQIGSGFHGDTPYIGLSGLSSPASGFFDSAGHITSREQALDLLA
jgi:hypothetical protein